MSPKSQPTLPTAANERLGASACAEQEDATQDCIGTIEREVWKLQSAGLWASLIEILFRGLAGLLSLASLVVFVLAASSRDQWLFEGTNAGARNLSILGLAAAGLLLLVARGLRDHLQRVSRRARQTHRDARFQTLITERKSQSQRKLQAQLLEELRARRSFDETLRHLFRRLGSDWSRQFAVLIDLRDRKPTLLDSRGLTAQSQQALALDDELIARGILHSGRIEDRRLRASRLLASLAPADRRKAQELYAIVIGDPGRADALLLTTRLFAVTTDPAQQLACTVEACACLADFLPPAPAEMEPAAPLEVDELHGDELRGAASESPAQPAVAPLARIGSYLEYLRKSLGVDRIALHSQYAPAGAEAVSLAECNVNLPPGVLRKWREHEARLLARSRLTADLAVLSPAQLQRLGIDSLLGVAALVAVSVRKRPIAILSITNGQARQFSQAERRLVTGCVRCVEELLTAVVAQSSARTADPAATPVRPSAVEVERAAEPTSAKLDFLAKMTHELRTPVNGILGMTQLIMDTNLTDEQREYLQIVQTSSESLVSLVNNVLDHSKLESGHLELDPAPFSVRDTLSQALRSIAFLAHAKRLEMCSRIAREIPESLVGDSMRLRQVLVNLIGNAIKFTERGVIEVTCEIQSHTAHAMVLHLCVRDSGIGIPTDKLHAIFEEYVQADRATARHFGGTGLGLSISQKLVEMMGGRIWVESQPGVGSQFHFTLRLRLDPDAQAHAPSDAVHENHVPLPGRVLVIDDCPTLRSIAGQWLEQWDVAAECVASADEALCLLAAEAQACRAPDAVLLDMSLPGSHALRVLEFVQELPAAERPAVVLLKSPGDPDQELQDARLAGLRSLLKPVDERELFRALLQPGRSEVVELQTDTSPAAEVVRFRTNASSTGAAPVPQGPKSDDFGDISLANGGAKDVRPLRVLVADDHPINQRFVERILRNAGHTSSLVGNGRDALQAVETGSFDVVLMDMLMPVMDGVAATAELRRREQGTGRRLPIVALTGLSDDREQARCRAAGVDAVLTKPFDAESLLTTLEAVVGPSLVGAPASPPPAAKRSELTSDVSRPSSNNRLEDDLQQMFRDMFPGELRRIRQAVATENRHELHQVAHSLKGAATCLGLAQVEEPLYQLERMGSATITPEAESLLQLIEERLQRAVEQW